VLPHALAERATNLGRDFVASMMTGVGQLCTSPGLVFVADTAGADAFIAAAAEALAGATSGPLLNAGIAGVFDDRSGRASEIAGVELVAHGPDQTSSCGARAQLLVTSAERFLAEPSLSEEIFGPSSLIVRTPVEHFAAVLDALEGQLTASVHAARDDYPVAADVIRRLELIAGRIVFNGWPTGVEVGHAMVHGGPFPATSAPWTTSVGSRAIERFLRPVAYQNLPDDLAPAEVQRQNPLGVPQRIDGRPPA